MKVIWLGTASLKIISNDTELLFDPFIPLKGSYTRLPKDAFSSPKFIFITHGHLDHIGNLNRTVNSESNVFCTETPYNTLLRKEISKSNLNIIKPGDIFDINGISIEVFKGKHIKFDRRVVLNTVTSSDITDYHYNIPWLSKQNKLCKENNETVTYLIKAEEKTVMIMGSLSLDKDTEYPVDPDILVLPYQGSSDLVTPAIQIIRKIKPKKVLLDHFDNTFPPISKQIDTSDIEYVLYGIIPVIRPVVGRAYDL